MSGRLLKSLHISLLFHCAILYVLFQFSADLFKVSPPLAIDLSLIVSPVPLGTEKVDQDQPPAPEVQEPPSPDTVPVQQHDPPSIQQPPPLPVEPERVQTETASPKFIAADLRTVKKKPVPRKVPKQPEIASRPRETPVNSAPKTVASRKSDSNKTGHRRAIAQESSLQPAKSAGIPATKKNLEQQYIAENFSYIRDRISGKVTYPPIARKMGWQGRVIVSFVIQPDGLVQDITVVKSCGFKALDQNAIKIIKACLPFPKPMIAAKITLPIVYRIN